MAEPEPGLQGVLETVLYYDAGQREQMEGLYRDVLGLPIVTRLGDGTSLRVGPGVVLLFDRARLAERDEPVAAHGTTGPSHACLVAAPGDYGAWKKRLEAQEVAIEHEESWPTGLHSLYFHDPAGNLIEIAEGDIWPQA